ncbi:MAG: 30S ribosomal protein S19e [Candidatus Hydrothermarchaeales archaeon]
MTTVYDIPASSVIDKASKELKKLKEVKPPDWARFIKTGSGREKQPEQKDWWYTRAASILRKIYIGGPIGITRLSRKYGSKKNRGFKPEARRKGSGAITKTIIKQLESIDLIKTTKKGRSITPKGVSFLDKISHALKKGMPELEKY